jgi:DNA-binding MarR family transcriptional regulator/GNAT superfamily N-acetyltransferase
MNAVAEIRSFNRFYTRLIGLLNEHLPASDFTLAEARVIYELATGGEQTAAELCRILDMDKAHLSRIVARFRGRGLIESRVNPAHGKQLLLSLTAEGQRAFAAADQGSRTQMEHLLSPLGREAQQDLIASMRRIRQTIESKQDRAATVRLRAPRPGDLGWITHRQAVLYHQEYGWDWTYEGLVAQIFAGFIAEFDPAKEDGWVAELDGAIVGSIFLMKSPDPAIAKLRLLYVEPQARGLGIGAKLVTACIERAKQLGYEKMTLWTNDILVSARRLYQAAGFVLTAEEKHHSFGKDLVGQTWILDLRD